MLETIVMAALVLQKLSLPLDLWRADAALEIADAYKWIHQATEGGEHAAPSRAEAAEWLEREWATLAAPLAGELLLEPLGDSGIVRLNLRPYRVRGGDRDALLDAFLASAAEVRPDRARFSHAWRALGDELRLGPVGRLTRDAWKALDADTAPRGYPAVHHSETYERTRRPAYRVLTAARAQALAAGLHERPLPSGVHDPHEPPAPDGIALISARSGGSCRPPGLSACEQIGYRLQTAGFLKSFLERFPVA